MNKRKYSLPNNRYERYLNHLGNNIWNEMTKTNWYNILCRFWCVQFGKSYNDREEEESYEEDLYSEVNEVNDSINEPINVKIDLNFQEQVGTINNSSDAK